MSTELLLRAAKQIREARGGNINYNLAVANWLDHEALAADQVRHTNAGKAKRGALNWQCGCIDCVPTDAVAVARAYLGEPEPAERLRGGGV